MYVYVIFMVFALGAQWIAWNRLPAAQVGNIHAPASSKSPLRYDRELWPVTLIQVGQKMMRYQARSRGSRLGRPQ